MKILFIQLGSIGDMILLSPAFKAVKEKYPDSEIHILAGRRNNSIIRNNPKISKIIIHDKNPFKLILEIIQLKSIKYDYLIDPKDHYSTEGSIIASLVNAKVKIGFNSKVKNKIFDFDINGIETNYELHSIQRNIKSLNSLGIEFSSKIPNPELFIEDDSQNYLIKFNPKIPFILINISAGTKQRLWLTERWIEFTKNIKKYNLILINSPSQQLQAELILKSNDNIIHFKTRSIQDVVAIVSMAKIVITPDTAVVHIASAFNIPTLVLFDSNEGNRKKFMPLAENSRIIYSQKSDGLDSISAEEVLIELNKMI